MEHEKYFDARRLIYQPERRLCVSQGGGSGWKPPCCWFFRPELALPLAKNNDKTFGMGPFNNNVWHTFGSAPTNVSKQSGNHMGHTRFVSGISSTSHWMLNVLHFEF